MRAPKPKLRGSKAAKKKADDVWSLYIRKRAGFRCELAAKDKVRCSPWITDRKTGKLRLVVQGAHLITRAAFSIRHDIRNGRSLCKGHHKFYSDRQHLWEELCERLWPEDMKVLQLAKWRNVNSKMYPFITADLEAKINALDRPKV